MAKASYLVAALLVMSLAVCGCVNGNVICNVSIGSTQSAISRGNVCMQPGLVTLPDGNLLTVLNCPGQIVTQMSTDNGATWNSNTPINLNGNAPALFLLPNGKLFLSTSLYNSSGIGVPTYIIGMIGPGDVITWNNPVAISTPGWTAGCWGYSPVVQLINGDLLWPVWCYKNETGDLPASSTVMLSTDGGLTWPKQVTVGDGASGNDYDESAAVVYPNGDIVMIIRHTNPGSNDQYGSYWRSKSSDNGNTWSDPIEVVNNVLVGRPTLGLLPSGGLVLLGRAEIAGINTTSFGTSWDEGLRFSNFIGLGVDNVPGTSDLYDAISLLPNGTLAVVTAHSNNSEGITNIDYLNLIDNCGSALTRLKLNGAVCPKGATRIAN